MDQQQLATNALLCAEFNALRAQVAINAGKPDEAGRLASEALAVFPLASYYGRIVATSIKGEVLHCRGDLNQALSLMQETCQMARHHDICHDALWALLQQSEILIAQGDAQSAYETRDNAFALIREQGLEQLPMHEFLLRLRAQLLWSWSRLDDAEQAVRQGLEVLTHFQPQQQLQCLAMLAKCALARGDMDNARRHLTRLENLLSNGHYRSDWVTNADKPRLLYWQMTGDRQATANWLHITPKPANADNHFLQGQWRNMARSCWGSLTRRKWYWTSLTTMRIVCS